MRILASASAIAESLADDVAAFLTDPAHRDIQVDIEERVSTGVRARTQRRQRLGRHLLGRRRPGGAADPPLPQRPPGRGDAEGASAGAPQALRFAQALGYEHVSLPPSSAVRIMLQRAAARTGQSIKYRVVVATFEAALRVVRAGLAISVRAASKWPSLTPRRLASPSFR